MSGVDLIDYAFLSPPLVKTLACSRVMYGHPSMTALNSALLATPQV